MNSRASHSSEENQTVLICNAGSSSLKLAECTMTRDSFSVRWQVSCEGSADELVEFLWAELQQREGPRIMLHRIVHAGLVPETPQRLDDDLLARIAHWAPLAPLHNTLALRLIDVLTRQWPQVSQFAVFDSGLYAHLPPVSARYALPDGLSSRWPVRRYGFHGLAHRSQWRSVRQACVAAGLPIPHRLISVQLGSGCSMTTWRDDEAIDTTMGFSSLDGLVMATRSGSVDPGILLHLLANEGMTVGELTTLLTTQSGLAVLSGCDGDMRSVLATGTQESENAVAHYCQQIRKALGAAMAVLGGVDAISIGGGVGEHQPRIRAMMLAGLEELGVTLDLGRNESASGLAMLHADGSRSQIWLTPVNEVAEMICQYQRMAQLAPEKAQ